MSEISLEILSKELVDNMTKAESKRLAYFDEAFTKLKRGNKEATDAMRVIEKSFQEELKLEKTAFSDLQAKVQEIEGNLKTGLDAYYNQYNVDAEAKKLQDSKDKGVQPKMMIYRKETHDANFKYDRILKEEKDTLREKQDNFDDFERNAKARVFDLEKRCRLEVNKEKAASLASYDNLQKQLLETNNRKEIKDINKQIQSIQKQGLKNEKEIKLNYQDLIKTEKLNYEENKKKLLIDILETETQYRLKKLEIEVEKKHINQRLQIELDKYDFGSKRAINNLNHKMVSKKNSLILSYKDEKKALVEKEKENQIERIKYKETVTNDLISVQEKNYSAFIETINMGTKLTNDYYVAELDKFTEYLHKVLSGMSEMLTNFYTEYFNNVVRIEYENVKLLLNAKYNYETLNKMPYENFLVELENLYNSFKENAVSSLKKHTEEIESMINDTKEYVNKMMEKLKKSLSEESCVYTYHKSLEAALNKYLEAEKQFENDAYKQELVNFPFIEAELKDYDNAVSEMNKENEEVVKKHEDLDAALDNDIKNYHDAKEAESANFDKELQDEIAAINKEKADKILEFENKYNEEVNNIKLEKEKMDLEIEASYNEAMKLLK